jgi:hypothetical protein
VVVFLIAVYAIGCCAFRNVRRAESEHPHSTHATMSKIRPRWDYHWFVLSIVLLIVSRSLISDCVFPLVLIYLHLFVG